MRINRLRIDRYKVLQDLELPLIPDSPSDDKYSLHFVVGVNGTGKSTLLRAIASIFHQLDQRQRVDFPFEIEYIDSQGRQVHIEQPEEGEPTVWINTPDDKVDLEETLLPLHVICFTTGSEAGWLHLPARLEQEASGEADHIGATEESLREWYQRELPASRPVRQDRNAALLPHGRVRVIPTSQIPLSMLCGWLTDLAGHGCAPLAEVLQRANFGEPTGFSLRFRVHEPLMLHDDLEMIKKLEAEAIRCVQQGPDRLLVFDLSRNPLLPRALVKSFGSIFDLFTFLSRLSSPLEGIPEPVLQQVNLFLNRVRDVAEKRESRLLHTFDSLSDGEQNFLGRMALMSLMSERDALVLLDEPEVHFNDLWKREIVHLLHGALKNNQSNSHVIIATHSSITLTDVERRNIIQLNREDDWTTRASIPGVQTFGANPGDLVTRVFHAEYPTGAYSFRTLRDMLEKELPGLRERDEAVKLLRKWQKRVAPGYWQYRIEEALLSRGEKP